MVRAIPALSPPFANIRSALDSAIPAAENGKAILPLLAAFATHNAQCHVADPDKPAAIQPLCASSRYKNVKSGKNGNGDHPTQHLPGFSSPPHPLPATSAVPSFPPSLLRVGSRLSSPPLRSLRFDLLPPSHRCVDPMLPAYVHCHPAARHNAPHQMRQPPTRIA